MPATRTAVANDYGDPADVVSIGERPAADPGNGELRVRVRFASVNPVDWKILAGGERKLFDIDFPFHPGCDGAGEVIAVGDGVGGFAVGDRVAFNSPVPTCGAMADDLTLPAGTCTTVPGGLDLKLAAALPVVAETARQALFDSGDLGAGQTVLIHGASGAVGSCAVQLAKRAGATVIGTASGENEQFARSLGVDGFINYREQQFERAVRQSHPDGVDLVLDTAGGETTDRSFAVLKRGGHLAGVADKPDDAQAADAGVTAEMVLLTPNGDRLADLLAAAAEGALTIEIARVFSLSEAAAAMEKQRAADFRGKLLLDCTK